MQMKNALTAGFLRNAIHWDRRQTGGSICQFYDNFTTFKQTKEQNKLLRIVSELVHFRDESRNNVKFRKSCETITN